MSRSQHFFVRLLGTRPDWPQAMTEAEAQVMEAHFRYLEALTKEGTVLMAGPVFDPVFGLVVLQTASEEEARAIMDREPSVTGGVHTYELSEMRVALLAGQPRGD